MLFHPMVNPTLMAQSTHDYMLQGIVRHTWITFILKNSISRMGFQIPVKSG